MASVVLSERGVVRIAGADAGKLLQDVITPDLDKLDGGTVLPGALLTPQGKVMFDFLIGRDGGDGFLIDIDRASIADFTKRMTLYRLRAKVEIAADAAVTVCALWDEAPPAGARRDGRFRNGHAVYRVYRDDCPAATADADAYTRLRIAAGVVESGRDYALSDAFPHDVLMDLNGGVSFRKGCFVGQEVVSRMQHRGTARRRVAIVEGSGALPAPKTAITADGKPLGTLGSVVGSEGLAIVRIDRVGAALARGSTIEAGGVTLSLALPEWSGLAFPTAAPAGADED